VKLKNFIVNFVANLSKTLHINFYKNQSTVEVMTKTFWCFYAPQCVLTLNKSPAVARVSQPYSWFTLATCVHNCRVWCFEHAVACARNV